LAVKLKYSI